MKCPLAGTNKRFLINTIKNTLPSQKEQDHEQKEGEEEPAQSQNQKEENQKEGSGRKRRAHPYRPSFQARGAVSRSPPRKRSSQDKYERRSNKRWAGRRMSRTVPRHSAVPCGRRVCREGYWGHALSWQSKHLRAVFTVGPLSLWQAKNDLETLQGN